MKYRKFIILLLFAALIVAAFYNGPVLRRYTVYTELGDEGSTVDFVVIADLHNTLHGENQETVISKIIKQNPDAILMVGDMIDNFSSTNNSRIFLERAVEIAPCYYVTGNHEFWTWKANEIVEIIKSYGVTVLRNENELIEINSIPINICGMDDPDVIRYSTDEKYTSMQGAKDLLEPFNGLKEDSYNILLAHRPELIEIYKDYNFDLVLSGHAHGGQVRIPLILNGLYAPNQGWFPKYAGGEYKHGELTHIVSRGLSIYPNMPRIFNPTEVVCVKVVSR
jgi:predicted MPP superfamily phosphohydrolase